MKTVKITYHCDYCGEVIKDGDDVHTIQRGRIGYDGENIPERDPDMLRHYHDSCIEHLMLLTPSHKQDEDTPEPEQEVIAEPDNAKTKTAINKEKVEKKKAAMAKKDLPALQAFIDAGKSQKWCAIEFGVVDSTIHYWLKEIMEMKKEGTWDAYCEERRNK